MKIKLLCFIFIILTLSGCSLEKAKNERVHIINMFYEYVKYKEYDNAFDLFYKNPFEKVSKEEAIKKLNETSEQLGERTSKALLSYRIALGSSSDDVSTFLFEVYYENGKTQDQFEMVKIENRHLILNYGSHIIDSL